MTNINNSNEPKELHIYIDDVHFTVLTETNDISIEQSKLNISHFHSFFEVFYVKNSYLDIVFENETMQIKQNSLMIVSPQKKHYLMIKDSTDSRYCFCFTFEKNNVLSDGNLYTTLSKTLSTEYLYIEEASQFHTVINSLFVSVAEENYLKTSLFFHEFIVKFSETIKKGAETEMHKPGSYSNLKRTYMLENFIFKHYAESISLNDIAEHLHLSTRQTNRIIQTHYGCTFREILAQKRINAATRLLTEGNMSVSKVAETVGYSSIKGFYNAFKKYCGCLPAQYRKKL